MKRSFRSPWGCAPHFLYLPWAPTIVLAVLNAKVLQCCSYFVWMILSIHVLVFIIISLSLPCIICYILLPGSSYLSESGNCSELNLKFEGTYYNQISIEAHCYTVKYTRVATQLKQGRKCTYMLWDCWVIHIITNCYKNRSLHQLYKTDIYSSLKCCLSVLNTLQFHYYMWHKLPGSSCPAQLQRTHSDIVGVWEWS